MFNNAISRATVGHSRSRFTGLLSFCSCSSSHFKSSYLYSSSAKSKSPGTNEGEALHKSYMWLNDHIESSCPNIAAGKYVLAANQNGDHRKDQTHYARGKERFNDAITSAIQMVADLETPTRQ